MEPLPGMPRPSVGMSSPEFAAFCADSLAAIPSTDPLPNCSGVLEVSLACWYEIIEAAVPLAPGMAPTAVPSTVPSRIGRTVGLNALAPGNFILKSSTIASHWKT